MTIIEAIKEILSSENEELTSKQIYEKIVEQKLYSFSARDPKSIVNGIIRKHCVGIDFPTASPVKHFKVSRQSRHVNYYTIYCNNKNEDINIEVVKNSEELLPEEKTINAYNEHKKRNYAKFIGCHFRG